MVIVFIRWHRLPILVTGFGWFWIFCIIIPTGYMPMSLRSNPRGPDSLVRIVAMELFTDSYHLSGSRMVKTTFAFGKTRIRVLKMLE